MFGNLREEFIFLFFASQELFAKIKTRKLSSMWKVNEARFNSLYLATNRSMASVPLMAEAIQDIEMLHKRRYLDQTVAQGREWKQSFLRVFSSPHWNKELRLSSLSITLSKYFFSC